MNENETRLSGTVLVIDVFGPNQVYLFTSSEVLDTLKTLFIGNLLIKQVL